MKTYQIAVLPGDGIGPEVMDQAIRVLEACVFGQEIKIELMRGLIGGAAYEKTEQHFPVQTKELCDRADAILFGSVGGPIADAHLPKWHQCEANSILALRKTYTLAVNLRPAKIYPSLIANCPLKQEIVEKGIDIAIFRELVGDIYFGAHERYENNGLRCARDEATYDEQQIRRIAELAFKTAQIRKKKVTSVDKANVLATSKLWREIVTEVGLDFPEVRLEHMLVDNCAMQLILNPGQFDVIVTSNLFGDILSDAAATLPGSLGLMPSASLTTTAFGLYEPSGGSAPEIAGKNCANPIAQILSAAMMLRYSFARDDLAKQIEKAVVKTLEQGFATKDIYQPGKTLVGTVELTDQIITNLEK